MYRVPPVNNCILSEEAITLKPINLRTTILGVGTIAGVELTACALKTVVCISHEADLIPHFEPFAFSRRVDLGDGATRLMPYCQACILWYELGH